MEARSQAAALTLMHQDFFKLDRFDGTNFNRWKDQMMFLLTALKISYVLDDNLPVIPDPEDNEEEEIKEKRKKEMKEIKEKRKKRDEDKVLCRGHILNRLSYEVLCRGHILNRLSYHLYNLFTVIKSPKEIWTTLVTRYNNEKQGTDKFLIMKYFEFSMTTDKPVMDQVHDLQKLKVEISESLQVGAFVGKLPTTWNDYRKKLLHTTKELSLEQLQIPLRIEEETRNQYKKQVDSQSDSKVNYVAGENSNSIPGQNKRKKGQKSVLHMNFYL